MPNLNLIVQVVLALIYAIFFSSVVPTYLISQPTPVANASINHYLLVKEPEILHQLPTPFQINVWSLLEGIQKVVWHTRLNVHIEISGIFSVCYKKFIGVLKVVTDKIYFTDLIFSLALIKGWIILIQRNYDCLWIKIEESPEHKFLINLKIFR